MNGKELVGIKEIEAPSKTSFNITVFGEGPHIHWTSVFHLPKQVHSKITKSQWHGSW
jgi:hypothetical protein